MAPFEFTRLRGMAFRATTYDTPLWVRPNRRPGRWSQPSDQTIAQYCSLDPAAPYAEFVRNEGIDEAEAAEARVGLWQLRVDEGAVLDISTPEQAEKAEVAWSALSDDDWSRCQELAVEVRGAGGRGIVAPSAALPGSCTLVLFGPRSELAWERQPRLSIQVPAREVVRGAPRPGIVRATRRFGDPYPETVTRVPIGHLLQP